MSISPNSGPSNSGTCLETALAYARVGLRVHPLHFPTAGGCSCGKADCPTHGKHPRLTGWTDKATAAEGTIRRWWQECPAANLGIVTGHGSGVVVLDVDPRHGGDQTLRDLEEHHGRLPRTWEVATGGGGRHYYFRHPGPAWKVRNSQDDKKGKKLGAGLDVKGDGGQVVAPPSLHPSGQRYQWVIGPGECALAELPDWLHAILAEPARRRREERPRGSRVPPRPAAGLHPYVAKALRDEAAAVAGAPDGARNNQLNLAAFALGQFVGAGALDRGTVEHELAEAARAAELGPEEIAKTIRSGLDAGIREPRDLSGLGQAPPGNGRGGVAPGASPPAPTRPEIHLTDLGNARRLAAAHGQDLRYCHPWKKWFVWDGGRWALDDSGEVMRRAKEVVLDLYRQAARRSQDLAGSLTALGEGGAEAERERLKSQLSGVQAALGWATKSESAPRLEALVKLAGSESGVPITPDALDRDPLLLNVANGTLDLRAGKLRPADRGDLLSKQSPVRFDPGARCPLWEAFLLRVMGGDAALVAFLRRAVGYSLTGSVAEQVLFFLHGDGQNGKSVFLGVLLALLGKDYGMQAGSDLLLARRGERHPTELADLFGKRCVATIEADEGRHLAEALVKQLTGGDKVRARRMREDFWEFDPTHKVWLSANHKPQVRGQDFAIWRRILLVPFAVTIPPEERDPGLPDKLRAELPGVLNWALAGCREWQRGGLAVPEAIRAATKEYKEEQDTFGQFLKDACLEGAGYRVGASRIYAAFCDWNKPADPPSRKWLAAQLKARGFAGNRSSANGSVEYLGLTLRNV